MGLGGMVGSGSRTTSSVLMREVELGKSVRQRLGQRHRTCSAARRAGPWRNAAGLAGLPGRLVCLGGRLCRAGLESGPGRSTWKVDLKGPPGKSSWKMPGKSSWKVDPEGRPGRSSWKVDLESQPEKSTWKVILQVHRGRSSWKVVLEGWP